MKLFTRLPLNLLRVSTRLRVDALFTAIFVVIFAVSAIYILVAVLTSTALHHILAVIMLYYSIEPKGLRSSIILDYFRIWIISAFRLPLPTVSK